MNKLFISILSGLLCGWILGKILLKINSFFKKNWYHGPIAKEITKNIYKNKNKCYQFITRVVPCPLE